MSRPCSFFARGQCRHGTNCRFSHDVPATNAHHPVTNGFTPPFMIDIPPGIPIFSIDVECAATSVGHNGRAVSAIGMVDENCRPLEKIFVKEDPSKPVLSYLGHLTGVERDSVEVHGVSFPDAVETIRRHLGPAAVIVGQNVMKDIEWLGLKDGVDYNYVIDLATVFRVWNTQRQSWTIFSQDHVAEVWLSIRDRVSHDCVEDASISMSLFNTYRNVQWDPQQLHYMQMATLHAARTPSFSAINGQIDGCCLGNRKTCICGEPFFIS